MSETLKSSFDGRKILIGTIPFIACLLIYILRLNPAVGLFKDDAWYLLLAESLSTGNGYQLLNFPILGVTPFYPPFYPIILALLSYLQPNFPENIWLIKSFSIASMFFLGLMIYYYFQKHRNLPKIFALAIALATTISPAFVFLATSTLMSECVFTTLQFATILTLEHYAKKTNPSKFPYLVCLGAVLVSSAFLTRTIGIVLIAGGIIFLASKRLWASTIIFIIVIGICIGPWAVYKKLTFEKPSNPLIEKQYSVTNYNDEFWKLRAGSLEKITLLDLPERFLKNIKEIAEINIGGMLLPLAFRDAKQSGEEVLGMTGNMGEHLSTKTFSWIFAIIALIGFFLALRLGLNLSEVIVFLSLALIIAWPWLPFRFVLTLFPFLIFYILLTFQHLCFWLTEQKKLIKLSDEWFIARIFLSCVIIFNLYDHLSYIQAKNQMVTAENPQWLNIHRAEMEMFTWINNNTPKESVIVSDNPALVFLYTRRKTLVVTEKDFKDFNVKYLVKTETSAPKSTILGTDILGKRLLYHNPDFNLMVLGVSDSK